MIHEKNDVIFHTTDRPVEIGPVSGEIDWARRFDHMQQHSGEHICSGMICQQYQCDNVGFHLGADFVTIDFNASISWEDLLKIEARANEYIYENHPVSIQFHQGPELEKLSYRSKKALDGEVRIVSFPGRRLLCLLRHPCCKQRTGGPDQGSLLSEVSQRRSD